MSKTCVTCGLEVTFAPELGVWVHLETGPKDHEAYEEGQHPVRGDFPERTGSCKRCDVPIIWDYSHQLWRHKEAKSYDHRPELDAEQPPKKPAGRKSIEQRVHEIYWHLEHGQTKAAEQILLDSEAVPQNLIIAVKNHIRDNQCDGSMIGVECDCTLCQLKKALERVEA